MQGKDKREMPRGKTQCRDIYWGRRAFICREEDGPGRRTRLTRTRSGRALAVRILFKAINIK